VRKPKTIAGMNKTWNALMAHAKENPEDIIQISQAFNDMLDDLVSEDFFGTEGQLDPRGDQRDQD